MDRLGDFLLHLHLIKRVDYDPSDEEKMSHQVAISVAAWRVLYEHQEVSKEFASMDTEKIRAYVNKIDIADVSTLT